MHDPHSWGYDVAMSETAANTSPLNARRWQAVVDRDSAQSGMFVYGVKTTGIYCRPGCASRQPKAANVVFFGDGSEAVASGFRACKRCVPDNAAPPDPTIAAMIQACRTIEAAETPPSLEILAGNASLSPSHFQRTFKRALGLSPKDYAQARRMERFRAALLSGDSVTDAIYSAGFNTPSRAHEAAGRHLGMVPGSYRAGASGEVIGYTQAPSNLGPVTIAATMRGIASISLGEDAITNLKVEFPMAELIHAPKAFTEWVTAVVTLIEEPRTATSLPLDIRGTAFQQQVWRALREIPPGTTATYKEIASLVGSPNAHRAVGSACGANRLAVAIPCHRAVRADGGLGGYRWGLDRKKTLLSREEG
jgi:AraC family transcriptional regulator, regulatory protein of adaptative response / methylated-DNA-[protein]-cysteine methyltransferase